MSPAIHDESCSVRPARAGLLLSTARSASHLAGTRVMSRYGIPAAAVSSATALSGVSVTAPSTASTCCFGGDGAPSAASTPALASGVGSRTFTRTSEILSAASAASSSTAKAARTLARPASTLRPQRTSGTAGWRRRRWTATWRPTRPQPPRTTSAICGSFWGL